jgi:hypothetical protein
MPRRSLKLTLLSAVAAAVIACSARPHASHEPRGFVAGRAQDFSASLYLADDGPRFVAALEQPGDPAKLNVTEHASRGQEIEIFLAVTGCAANVAGFCDVRADFEVRDSDGKTIALNQDVSLWRDPPRAAPGKVLFGEATLALKLGADAPAGNWEVGVTVYDRVRNQSVVLQTGLLIE